MFKKMITNFISNPGAYLANANKAIINLIGLEGVLLSYGLIPDAYKDYVTSAVGILTVVVHYITPNAAAPGTTPATESFEPVDEREPIDEAFKPAPIVIVAHAKMITVPQKTA